MYNTGSLTTNVNNVNGNMFTRHVFRLNTTKKHEHEKKNTNEKAF